MLKVLIAEDNVILADMLEDFLISEGYDVCGVAATVEEAIRLADLYNPDLAVLDFRLAEGGYGSQILPRLKDKTGIGILYASGDALQKKLTLADGDAYIQKPFGMNDLLRSLRIVQGMETDKNISATLFPENFHLLKNPAGADRKFA
jgi:DNA-binding response OmpR family regulator